jgi:hypothetical protein
MIHLRGSDQSDTNGLQVFVHPTERSILSPFLLRQASFLIEPSSSVALRNATGAKEYQLPN